MSGSRTLIIASVILVNISIFFVFKNLIFVYFEISSAINNPNF